MVRIGVDVGGTGIQVGVVNEEWKIIGKGAIPTRTDLSFEEQVRQIAECIQEAIASAGLSTDDVTSVGIGIPGIAAPSGEIIKCTNLGWHHVPFREIFTRYLDKPVLIDNDANVAALAESVIGISAGSSSSVFITLGTGIGSGIVINGKIWSGFHGIGGELGHTILRMDGIPCTCGNRGCLERYCSATAIIRMAREAVKEQPYSEILNKAQGDPEKINAKIVIDAAKEHDPTAEHIFHTYASSLAQAIANVINFLDPEVIVLGGGVSKAGDFLLDAVRREYPQHVIFRDQPMARLELAVLGPEAGIIGAAMLS